MAKRLEIGILALLGPLLLGRAAAGSADLPSGLAEALARREYEATRNAQGLQAPNRAHNLRTYFVPQGVRLHDRTAAGSPELLSLTLSGVGRGHTLAAVEPGEVAHAGARVEIRRQDLVEWYENGEAGLEQGFTLAQRPRGPGELILELDVARARAELRGDRVVFETGAGRRLEYGKLAVKDTAGRGLPARLEVPAPDRVRLVVDDAGARYPLDIDPLITGGSDFDFSPGQLSARLGLGVASAGDVNGDGYADILVGAYLYDGGNTDEGRAWVWYGGPGGIAGVPAPSEIDANQNGAQLGSRVASAGDVNGDGYDDVIVGAPFYLTGGGASEGAAFLFHGGPGGIVATGDPANAATRLSSTQVGSRMGQNVAGIGDVNGDGYADVAVAATHFTAGQSQEGSAFVFLGGASGIAHADQSAAAAQLQGDESFAEFGVGLAGAGDVNGDGYADVIVGSPFYGGPDAGGAFVFLGSASGIASAGAASASSILVPNQAFAQFGWSVAGAGDVNGDGFADVIVGTIEYDTPTQDAGAAFIFHGGASGVVASGNPTNANTTLSSTQGFSYFGISVAGAGDVDGDGYADVAVGAFGFDRPIAGDDHGEAYVFRGGPTGVVNAVMTNAFVVLTGPEESDAQFGVSVAGAGDVNGDGFADVMVGAWLEDVGATDSGNVYVYHGGSRGVLHGGPATAQDTYGSPQSGASVGYGLAGAGDVNGDGYSDLIVGAYQYDDGQTDEGAAFVYHGGPDGLASSPSSVLQSNQEGASFGYSVASAGDVNADGYGDVIIGADLYDSPGNNNDGAAFLFHGSAAGLVASGHPGNANAVLESHQDSAFFGYEVDGAGDVNGDGHADVIVGAFAYDNGIPDEGAAFVFHGSVNGIVASGPAQANSVLESNAPGAAAGYSVAGVGDLNGDSYGDVAVGAVYYTNGQSNEGAVFVFHGGLGGLGGVRTPADADARFEANQSNAAAGSTVSAAGDVNGDGYGDLVTGASLYSNPESQEGAAFIFHGSATGIVANATPANANTLLQSNDDGAFLGTVDAAGDVNGDGYADVIVGAANYGGASDPGAAFVFLGSAAGVPSFSPSQAATVLQSAQTQSEFGVKVAGLGDVNGDGFADVAVGAHHYDAGALDGGAAFTFYGAGRLASRAGGRPVLASQHRPDGSDLRIQPGSTSHFIGEAEVRMLATHPAGRGRVKLQIEACPSGSAFGGGNGCATVTTPGWTDVSASAAGVALGGLLSGLSPPAALHRWRARVLYAPFSVTQSGVTAPPNPAHGPWRRLFAQGFVGDVFTSFDTDGDGSTDDWDNDDDNDGLLDIHETNNGNYLGPTATGTDPRRPDSDSDGLGDAFEVGWLSNPNLQDTDSDGLSDDLEYAQGSNPTEPDSDFDGLPDAAEVFTFGTHPGNPDTDGDGLQDGEEWFTYGSSPTDPDVDDDGDLDGADNCLFIANASQQNSDPFGAGDACQCGNVDGAGGLTAQDYQRAREHVAGRTPSGPFDPDFCDVNADASCDVEDLAILARVASGVPAGLLDGCAGGAGL